MRESEFLSHLLTLLNAPVAEMNDQRKAQLIHSTCDEILGSGEDHKPITCKIVPFTTGWRSTDEAEYPGLGSSDNVCMILPTDAGDENGVYILYKLDGLSDCTPEMLRELTLDITLSFCGADASLTGRPIPGWDRRPLTPTVLERESSGNLILKSISLDEVGDKTLCFRMNPFKELLPGASYRWEDADPELRATATDDSDPFTFGTLFTQMLLVQVRVTHRNIPIASDTSWVDICDTRRFGSLYQRVLHKLVKLDTDRQAKQAGVEALDPDYHPWSPVLLIGYDKALFYMTALINDIVYKKRNLTDPHWLMRVGIYLEFLTCMGIFEAVKNEVGDLLTPAERSAFDQSPLFSEIRKRINPNGWKEVWKLKDISFPKMEVPSAGPVSTLNLLQKRKAVLMFLHVHHQDLKQAIELAGSNWLNAQETWGLVFRDAERAVLRKTTLAFPELQHLNKEVVEFILWHQEGKLGFLHYSKLIPAHFSEMLGDQDGLFAAACNQYRKSMNEVADWSKQRKLIDFTGSECVPAGVSLLKAYLSGNAALLEHLQKRDGYTSDVEIEAELPDLKKMLERLGPQPEIKVELPGDLFAEVPIFKLLSLADRLHLARTSRIITLGPLERVVVQGEEGSSLFLVADGSLEVLVREESDNTDQVIATLKKGDTFGELSLLTGGPRNETVRAIDSAVVYEIGKAEFEPIIRKRPDLVEQLGALMDEDLKSMEKCEEAYEKMKEEGIHHHIRRHFFFGRSGEKK